jgi:hypothetical protein
MTEMDDDREILRRHAASMFLALGTAVLAGCTVDAENQLNGRYTGS